MIEYTRRSLLATFCGGLATLASPRSQADNAAPPDTGWIASLSSVDTFNDDALKTTANQFLKWQEETGQSLIDQLSAASTDDEKMYAIYFLGALKVGQAGPFLVRNIGLKDISSRQNGTTPWYWNLYPATTALTTIGSPCIPDIVDGLASTDDLVRSTLLLETLSEICSSRACVEAYLNDAIQKESDSTRKFNLQTALSRWRAQVKYSEIAH